VTAPGPARVLALYVAGASARSAAAIESVDELRVRWPGRFDLHVIDIREDPDLATTAGVLCTPTLVALGPRRVASGSASMRRLLLRLGVDQPAGEIESAKAVLEEIRS
jgi:hypothetical protein